MDKRSNTTTLLVAVGLVLAVVAFGAVPAFAGPLTDLVDTGTIALAVTAAIGLLVGFGLWPKVKEYIDKVGEVAQAVDEFKNIFAEVVDFLNKFVEAFADKSISKEELDNLVKEAGDVKTAVEVFVGRFR